MKIFPLALFAIGAAAIDAQLQDPPDVAKLITEIRAAHQAVESAHYTAHFELAIEGRPETYTRDGEVWFVRHPPPTPPPPPPPGDDDGVIAAIPLTGPQSELGANVRIELETGGVTSFDGEMAYILMPEAQKLIHAPIGVGGERFITGNITGNLVETPLLQADRLPTPPQGELRLAGEETIDGVECHVIEFRQHDTEMLTGQFETIWIGKEDLLMRKRDMRYAVGGQKQRESWLIRDLEIGVDINDSIFVIETPEDYEIEVYEPDPPPPLLAAGTAAPAWTLKDAGGNDHSFSEYAGQIVVLDFWATWCGPCLMAMPAIQKVHEAFANKGVVVIGVSCNEREGADPAGLMREKGYTYGLLLNGEQVTDAYRVSGFPTMYIIDGDGKIVESHVGYSAELESELTDSLNALLDGE